MVDLLLACGGNIETLDDRGSRSLYRAVYSNNKVAVQLLLERNSDLFLEDHIHDSPLTFAAQIGLTAVKPLACMLNSSFCQYVHS